MVAGKLIGGRYELADRVGGGGMGVVWRAHDNLLDRTVAVKQLLITPGLSTAEADEATRRALREGRIAARLHHPHAIAVYDVAEEDGLPWLVMEYLQSQSLADILESRGTFDQREAARIGAEVASALTAAHAAGIVHRDIKPANVLVGNDGSVKITDFGISRATGDVTVTATGLVSGTPAYLAPEVARGGEPDASADVFSLGALLYTLVEGTPPFGKRENTFALLHAVAAGEIEPPKHSGPLTPLLLDMLDSEPGHRPTMRQAQEVLERIAAGLPVAPARSQSASREATSVISPAPRRPVTPPPTAYLAPEPTPTVHDRPAPTAHDRPAPVPTVHERPAPAPIRHERPAKPRPAPVAQARPASAPAPRNAEPKGRRGVGLIIAVVLVGSLIAIGVLVAALVGNRDNSSGSSANTTPISVSEEPGSAVTFEQQKQFVINYYSLLPDDTDSAYAELSTNYQASNSRSSYDAFWSDIESVTVDSVEPGRNDSVNVKLTYHEKSGGTTTENRWIAVNNTGGDLEIWSSGTF